VTAALVASGLINQPEQPMFKRALTILTIFAALALAAPGFARAPQAGAGDKAVDVAKTGGEEKGKASGEQHGRIARQDKHRGASKHQDKQRGKELHTKQ
jgi:hypothetical protein